MVWKAVEVCKSFIWFLKAVEGHSYLSLPCNWCKLLYDQLSPPSLGMEQSAIFVDNFLSFKELLRQLPVVTAKRINLWLTSVSNSILCRLKFQLFHILCLPAILTYKVIEHHTPGRAWVPIIPLERKT
jgi:hypothetical protein